MHLRPSSRSLSFFQQKPRSVKRAGRERGSPHEAGHMLPCPHRVPGAVPAGLQSQ